MQRYDAEFTAYVRDHRRQLLRHAYLLVGHWAAAEDITQISLAKLYVAWPRIRSSTGPHAYARRVISRTVVDEARRPWRREKLDADVRPDRPDPTTSDGFSEVGSDLLAALRLLPLRQRQVVVLRHFWDLSVADTAADLGISAGSVKSHNARALHSLNRLLTDRTEEVSDA